jgi:hypothetical protein
VRILSLRTPTWTWLVFLLGTLLGGWTYNTVHAHGHLVAEGTGEAVTPATLAYGARQYSVDDQGTFDIPDLPRGARITVLAPGWTRKEFGADETEVRLTVGVVNFNVSDPVSKGLIVKPEARDGIDHTKTLGVGTETGSIAVPLPPPDIFICAKDYEGQTVHIVRPIHDVKLQPKAGDGCPVPPPPSPSPSPSGSVAPSASPAASPSSSP